MFYRYLSRIVESLVVLIMGTILTIVTIEVVLRYFFKGSLNFTEELSRYLMVWIVFLASALAIRDGAHIQINVLVKKFPVHAQKWIQGCSYSFTLVFLIIIVVEGFRILPQQLQQMCVTINVPLFYFYLAIPVGSLLMIIFMLPIIRETLFNSETISSSTD